MEKTVVNFGSLNIDYVYEVPHMVQPGETLHSRRRLVGAGGKGGNQSIALAKAGAKVAHAGKIGPDGALLRETLEKAGVNTDLLFTSAGASGHAIIQVDADGQNSIILFPGANFELTAAEIDRVVDAASGGLLLLQNEINALPEIMRKAHAAGCRLAFNFAPFSPEDAGALPLELVDYLIVNEIEGAGLSGVTPPEEILAKLSGRFPNTVIILTIGKDGVIAREKEQIWREPAVDAKVVDTTSAGDTFIGYLLAGILEGMPLPEALKLASRASAITVSRPGAADSIPHRSEL
ncbi:ribokinase [Victivallis sp. Marseille-Q1083]|uniref:ribokinase n=1 Tax=Victivallis sp. Marseille-Q1083 TaxID=2717288 RepID=UPI0015889F02|nr:ribokinase [Victivallis sp. Marseille-Q1083]